MTLERDHAADLFGLAGTFPRPGWIVLDAARDHRFTGELVFDVTPEIRVYLDRGRIYLAERSTDPSLGARLVDAGALNAAQLEHGSMRVGDTEHLGRLFERVPSVDRQATMLITELMNESCAAALAGQRVNGVTSTPYRHHASGIHRWNRPADAIDLSPGDQLPAPEPTAAPVEIAPPESVFAEFSNDTDALIHWDEPSWLDERTSSSRRVEVPAHSPNVVDQSVLATDWVDRLEQEGLPEPGSDPLAPTAKLPSLPAEPVDRFELIWPSGEIDADFPAATVVDGSDDRDRAGPTARVARSTNAQPEAAPAPDEPGLWDVEATGPSFGPVEDRTDSTLDHIAVQQGVGDPSEPDVTDDVALAMRRAVASIETGSLEARRRLSETTIDDSSRGSDLVVPGRVATRTESSIWSAGRAESNTTRSVFDEPAARPDETIDQGDVVASADAHDVEPKHVSALRRLIGGLRRH